ncbi:hypothetical protein K504DRAFT_394172, partial [Pleomassaria siparia CBS 279.74]
YTGRLYNILSNKTYIFIKLYSRLDIPKLIYPKVFPNILTDCASIFYIDNVEPSLT